MKRTAALIKMIKTINKLRRGGGGSSGSSTASPQQPKTPERTTYSLPKLLGASDFWPKKPEVFVPFDRRQANVPGSGGVGIALDLPPALLGPSASKEPVYSCAKREKEYQEWYNDGGRELLEREFQYKVEYNQYLYNAAPNTTVVNEYTWRGNQ